MVDAPKTPIQGEIIAQKAKRGPGYTGLITPHATPEAWYIEVFPSYGVLESFALTHGLQITLHKDEEEDDELPENNNSRKRK